MPIFEYKCKKCDHTFEKLVFKGDKEEMECPRCKSREVIKLMSAASFMGSSMGTCAGGSPKGFS